MRFTFSIMRLLMVVAIFGLAFACTRPLGTMGFVMALLPAGPIAAIVLISRKEEAWTVARLMSCTLLGALCGFFLGAVCEIDSGRFALKLAALGALPGWLVGMAFNRLISTMDRANREAHAGLKDLQ